jgi:hypothetical protein
MKRKSLSELFEKAYLMSVVPLGFEPRAAGLENLCSIQLSYGTACFLKHAKVKNFPVRENRFRRRTTLYFDEVLATKQSKKVIEPV